MKTALILHGWPQYDIKNHFLVNHLRKKGYIAITPNLFSGNYHLSLDSISREVERSLGKEELNLIVGISMGGLIAPYFAKIYKESRLIFIASGPKLESNLDGFQLTLKIARFVLSNNLFSFLVKSPDFIIKALYKFVNPFKGDEKEKGVYERDTNVNVRLIKKIPLYKEKEILDFIAQTDNTKILRNLKNKTLIFSGENDLFMTKDGGKELDKLLKNSKLIINKGSHFNTFTEKDLMKIDSFLKA